MPSSSSLTVDLGAIYHNIKKLIAAYGQVMVMVKANAYGTDPILLSKFLQTSDLGGVPFLGVSHVAEGIRLREAGITLPIFVIAAPPYESEWVAQYGLTPAVSTTEEVEALNHAAQKRGGTIAVHLHLNTGMNRFGTSATEALKLYQAIKKASHLKLEGVMTHFAAAESPHLDPFTHIQIKQFKDFLDQLPSRPRWIHAANSAGAVRFPLPFCNLVRIGLGVLGYGICLEGSLPSLNLTTTLASVSWCTQGESVGYNSTYRILKEREKIGVIPVGYHDGFHRSLSGKGYVLIQGKKAPMIGTICMDFMMLNLTNVPEAQVGDTVTLFGEELSVEQVAKWADTDVREILVSLPDRVKRVWSHFPLPTYSSKIDFFRNSARFDK